MKIKTIFVFITLFICSVFPAPNVNLVSPYIMRGFSQTYSMSFHPEKFTGIYETEVLQSKELLETQLLNVIGINDKFEIGIMGFGIVNHDLFLRLKLRTAFKLYEKGSSSLFENISLTSFAGVSVANFNLANGFIDYIASMDNELWLSYVQSYIGMSVGTRKKEVAKNSFELFSSFSYSLTRYELNNDFGSMSSDFIYKEFDYLLKHEISVPIGFRLVFFEKPKTFSVKSGIGFHFAFPNSNMDFKYSEATDYAKRDNEGLFYKISYLSAFAEMGFHFGAR